MIVMITLVLCRIGMAIGQRWLRVFDIVGQR